LTNASNVFTVSGAGTGIGGKADGFYYAYESANGNFTVTALVDAAQTGSNQAGLMVRSGLGANAREVSLLLTGRKIALVSRKTTGAAAVSSPASVTAGPIWERLTRKGNVFTASTSSDNVHWKTVGSVNLPLGNMVDVGLAVTSGHLNNLNTAKFSRVTITN
jgi:regulation of enolase protein 1 (concanavalin A-like superfamily)